MSKTLHLDAEDSRLSPLFLVFYSDLYLPISCQSEGFHFCFPCLPVLLLSLLLFNLKVIQLFVYPMDCSPPGSSAHEISQARILEWVNISFSRGPSWPGDRTQVPCIFCIGKWIIYHCATWEAYVYKQPSPVFLLGNPMDREAWQVIIHGVAKS